VVSHEHVSTSSRKSESVAKLLPEGKREEIAEELKEIAEKLESAQS